MQRKIDHSAMGICGFVEPWSGAAGRRLVSLSATRTVRSARIVRLDRDNTPIVDWPCEIIAQTKPRSFSQGSWFTINLHGEADFEAIGFELMLTRNSGRRVLLDGGSFSLQVENGNQLILVQNGAETPLTVLPLRTWLKIELSMADGLKVVSLDMLHCLAHSLPLWIPKPIAMVFCSDIEQSVPTLSARLANPELRTSRGTAHWSFPTLFTREPLMSEGLQVPLVLRGNPTFSVTSSRWNGSCLDPRIAPRHYDAIHFHDTDIEAFDWPASLALDIPADAPSGVYAVEVIAGEHTERLPFFVASPEPQSALLFVVPTATYLAYADEYLPPHLYEWLGTDRGHVFARDNDLRSLYDYHSDASGVTLTTTRRPKATLRDDYVYPLCGDPHLLPVDLHFLRFASRMGIRVDVVTDQEVHEQGAELLVRYKGVLTGSHPEYLSAAMESAYRQFLSKGGKLAYLGGNGFAATIAFQDDLMELRRGPTQAGRTWDGPLAEMNLALTNEPGGYLRDRGRGEFNLVGVGIALMGFTQALPFTRTAASKDPEYSWLFAGVKSDSFGDSGIVLGGAAGYEVDSTNFHLGTPDNIVVLATASGFPDSYVDDPGRWYENGEPERWSRRVAEMTYLSYPAGGAVFSASSVCWLGALPGLGAENDVGRITANLLLHFSS